MKKEFPIKPSPIKEGKTKSNVKKSDGKGRQAPPPPALKKDVPMYDPQTGEPNPLYEELTGERNPLTIIRGIGNEGMLIPSNFEPVLKNRFLVILPESLGVKPYQITEVSLPSIETKETGFFGYKTKTISPLSLSMIESLKDPKIGLIHAWLQDYTKFDVVVEQLDPKNVVIQRFELKDCHFTRIDCEVMNYAKSDNEMYNFKVEILAKSFNIN